MQRLRHIQTQIILIIAVSVIALTAALETLYITRQRDILVENAYQQGLLSATALRESIDAMQTMLLAVEQNPTIERALPAAALERTMQRWATANLSRFITTNETLSVAALVTPESAIYLASDSEWADQSITALNLAALPFDRAERRSVPGYGDTYLTRIRISVSAPFAPAEYDIITGVPAANVDDPTAANITSAIQVMLAVLVVTIATTAILIRRGITRPLRVLENHTDALSAGTLDTRATPNGTIELRNLARAFNQMAYRVAQSHNDLVDRYHALETSLRDHTRDIEISAQIGRIATRLQDVDSLLNETVQQIEQRFDSIYHAQIFLMDDINEFAVLVASTGDAGQLLLAFNHKLPTGSNSVIGRVVARGEVVIVADTLEGDVPWKPNPLLPNTRAEMALPMMIENRVIGALDVQSTEPGVFTGEMVDTFQLLADQIAIGIENARLIEVTENRLRQIDALNQQLTKTNWQQYLSDQRGDRPQGYAYDRMNTVPLGDDPGTVNLTTAAEVPIRVHDEEIGTLITVPAVQDTLSADDQRLVESVAERVALAIENARLFEQTQHALAEVAILYRASREMTNADASADILRAFVESITSHPVTYANLYVLLGESTNVSYAALELVAAQNPHPDADPVGTRYRITEFPFWSEIYEPHITHFADIMQIEHPNADVITALRNLGLHSVMVIPLHSGEHSIGAIVLGTETPWAANDNEIRIAEALADQAAIAQENTRLYRQTRRRARQLATSAQISRAITSILHLDELLPQVVNQIREGFDYDHVQVFLISDDGTRANLVASTGDTGRELLARGHYLGVGSRSVIGQVTELGEPQIALDTADARVIHRPNPLLPKTRSEMALPLIARGQILGALDVQSNMSGAFTDDDTRALTALTDMIATAIVNAQLFELAEERAEEMEFLFTITTAAATSSDLDESLAHIVETIRTELRVSNASVYLSNDAGDELTRGATSGDAPFDHNVTQIIIDRGIVGWVARHREPLMIGDLSQDPRRIESNRETQSAIAVPLITGGTLTGVLTVESDQLHAFENSDLRLLQTLSSSLAAIIQNSRLLRDMQTVNEQLLEVDRLKTNFLAAMSHELRTPLNSIIGFSRVILKGIDGPLTDTQSQDLNTIYESGKHLLGLVNDILDQAKIEAGKMELAYDYFKLQDVIKGVMSSAVGLTREKDIALYTEIEGELPDAYGDEFRTRQVLLNLISNAAKFTEEGSITLSAFPVELNGFRYIQVSVADTGIGIAEADMPKLFEAFQQVDNSLTRRVGGTGMGLPLARSFTELQHGQMWVESEVGVGSTFNITVPTELIPDDEDADIPGAGDVPAAPNPTPIQSATVMQMSADQPQGENVVSLSDLQAGEPPHLMKTALVIEDNEGVIGFYKRYLTPEGYNVIGVTDATSVRFTLAARPDVILLDVNMKDGAGWHVLEELRTLTEVPVIVCSIDQDRERGLELGAFEYILKPFSQKQLIKAVRLAEAETNRKNNRQRILLVDDQPETVRDLREALAASPRYDLLEATSGEQALDLLNESGTVDLVVLDLRMPGIDGFEVLQSMRADDRTAHIPVLILTAEDISAAEQDALQSIEVFRKDAVDEDQLLSQVAAQLNSNGENDEF